LAGRQWEKDTKTHQTRRVVLDPETVQLLTEHYGRCAARAKALDLELDEDARLTCVNASCTGERVTGVKGSQVQILSSRQKNPKPAGLGSLISGFGEGHWDEH
jgi:hypothetical protein